MALTREILRSHPVRNLKAELRKLKKSLNYGKLRKEELIDLMMKNKDKFQHIKMYKKKKRIQKIVSKKPIDKKKIIKRKKTAQPKGLVAKGGADLTFPPTPPTVKK